MYSYEITISKKNLVLPMEKYPSLVLTIVSNLNLNVV